MSTSLVEAIGRDLRWTKPNANRREFQLRDNETTVATLTWQGNGSRARGSTTQGSWILSRGGAQSPAGFKGALQPGIIVQPEGGGEAYEINPGLAEAVRFDGDSTFRWDVNDTTRTAKYVNADGEPLVSFDYSPSATEAEVTLHPAASDVPQLSQLILTGWYALRNGRG
jgi:hypothetical protein